MKKNIQWPIYIIIFLMILFAGSFDVYAGCAEASVVGGEAAAVSVANVVHSAGEVNSLFEQYKDVMDRYEKAVSPEEKKKLLEEARNILAKLVEQANDVESQISTASKKKLHRLYSTKLDRILKNVRQMREMAQKRMKATVKAG